MPHLKVIQPLTPLLLLAALLPALGAPRAAATPPAKPVDLVPAPADGLTDDDRARLASIREYAEQIRIIRHRHFGRIRAERIRQEGIAKLAEFTDPIAFRPMWEELRREKDDVRLAVLDHFKSQGDEGQAALALVAIYELGDDAPSRAIRHEATRRMVQPASKPVLHVLDRALRSPRHDVANGAGTLAGALNALETIPLLIFAQAGASPPSTQGDLAWIAVSTQEAYVAELVPIVGDGAVAFQPIPGIVTEGFVFRAVDAVVIFYRTEIHRVLVDMTTQDWGHPTDDLAYDIERWRQWYNEEYVPFKERQALLEELAEVPEETAAPPIPPTPPGTPDNP